MPAKLRGLFDRFWEKVEKTETCWNWTGALTGEAGKGYGVIWFQGKQHLAHRLSYELYSGHIPPGRTIDHICRNRSCVRPDHLRAVSMRENVLASTGISAVNWQKTHCHRGHPFNEGNTLWIKGRRQCRACNRERSRQRYRAANGIASDAPLHTRSDRTKGNAA